jgi:energy-coupling factor transport system permease protein
MLAASILWLTCVGVLVGAGSIMSLASGRLPVVTLMVSMTMRLVPQVIHRGRVIADVRRAWRVEEPPSIRERVTVVAADSGTLMGWTLADSVQTADAMRARGWGSERTRTSWHPYVLRASDIVALAVVVVLGIVALALAIVATSQFAFYPTMSQLVVWWGYVPVALFALLPTCAGAILAARMA